MKIALRIALKCHFYGVGMPFAQLPTVGLRVFVKSHLCCFYSANILIGNDIYIHGGNAK